MSKNAIPITNSQESDRVLANRPKWSSASLGWQGLTLEYRCMKAGVIPEIYTPWHVITFVANAPKIPNVVRSSGGKQWSGEARLGDAVIIPAMVGYGVEWDTELETLTLVLEPPDLATAIDEAQDPAQVEIIPQFSQPDPLLYQLGLGLKGLLENGEQGSRLYADTLTHTLMVHIMQHYTTRTTKPKTYKDGLPMVKLQLVLDYIQAHLDQDLGLKELANLLQLSPHYFSHLFKQSVGIAPHQYVVQQRVQRAKQLLKQADMTIGEVAYAVGFANQAHLNRHFKRMTGITPGAFRRE
ncbi:helix-turn-helix domain-containing protein [Calothrix rhizosoleniae]|uniref:helix-turn-helix domain-containing protein n=1 Tax=Calothrix rhizosoleniae TaxID=888997 RepID=UPI000B498B5E|nr:AraC family transcriptional regulator [Calothrix rhizosoleniae]